MLRALKFGLGLIALLLALSLAAGFAALRDNRARPAAGVSRIVPSGEAEIEYLVGEPLRPAASSGSGPAGSLVSGEPAATPPGEPTAAPRTVVLLASYARSASDFNELAAALNAGGYRTITMQPRGMEGSSLPDLDPTLATYAADLAAILDAEEPTRPVAVVGHAFGNRIARAFSAAQPERVHQLILLAAGGEAPTPESARSALLKAVFQIFPDRVRREAIAYAFFAKGREVPEMWMRGWYPMAALAQANATAQSPPETWADAGKAPMLILEPEQDAVARGAGERIRARFPERVQLEIVPDAGHAILNERPRFVRERILRELEKIDWPPPTARPHADAGKNSPPPVGAGPPGAVSAATAAALGADPAAAPIDHARLVEANRAPDQWLAHGRTYDEQRHSPLDKINAGNVHQLGLAWSFDLPTKRGLEATPLFIGDTLYFTGAWSRVFAVDARTGALRWEHDPLVDRASAARAACCDVVNRGLAAWGDRVFVGTLDGRLVALDSASGDVVWETLTVDPAQPYTITGAPRVIKGKVLIGNGGAEYGVRGYVSAYDAATGALAWRFYTVPGDPAKGFESEAMARAAETWSGQWWRLGGGGTVWDSMAYDPDLDLLYIGVGNGSPWNRRLRSPGGGDNLFLSSIVALRPETGEYVWHYQVVPAETWDYTATQHMILADLDWKGTKRKVLMQAPKSGFFILLDRETGEFLSAEPYAEVSWATHYDPATGRPVEVPGQDYSGGSVAVKPTSGGAHNWQPMAFHPKTRFVYLPVMEAVTTFEGVSRIDVEPGLRNRGVTDAAYPPGDALFLAVLQEQLAKGHLLAWDPRAERAAWRYPLPAAWNGGLLASGEDLIFQGGGDRFFRAHSAQTGELLWQFPTQMGVIATPMTYALDGEQYVSVLAGWGGSFGLMSGVPQPPAAGNGRLLTFKLGGTAKLPPIPAPAAIPEPPARMEVSQASLDRGAALFSRYCVYCHGTGMVSGGTVPDLRRLPPAFHDNFDTIVRGGAFASLGMPAFGDVLSESDARSIQAFIIEKAHEDKAEREAPAWWTAIKRFFYRVASSLIMFFLEPTIQSA